MAQNYAEWSSSDSEFTDENSEDLSHCELDVLPNYLLEDPFSLKSVQISHNNFVTFPKEVGAFLNLVSIDISNNGLTNIGSEILHLKKLNNLTAKNNLLDNGAIPKDFGLMTSLETINLSGNRFSDFPMQLTEIGQLKCLFLGANQITSVPSAVKNLTR